MTQTAWETWDAINAQDGAGNASSAVTTAKPKRAVAWDARTDRAMEQVLFQMAELCSQFRRWQRAAWRLDHQLALPELADHPKRDAAERRWEKAVDRAAEICLSLWDLAPAAAASWAAYSPARREQLARAGRWPAIDATSEEATGFFRDEFLFIAWQGALGNDLG